MKFTDILSETYTALSANKVRSGLTVLGIVIGIASVIAMVSVGQGAQSSIQSSIESIGSNLLQITPGATRSVGGYQATSQRGSAQTLTIADADAILQQVQNVSAVSKEVSSRYQVTASGTNSNTTVLGVEENYLEVHNVAVATGEFFSNSQSNSLAKVAVLGPTTATDLFGEGVDPIGQKIRINGVQFKVVGVSETKGGSGFNNQDDRIYIPLKTAQRFLSGNAYLGTIAISATDSDVMTQVQNDVTDLLLSRHKITDPTKADFSVLNQADILQTASSITGTFTALLAAIAGISLLVGGIGIMNMMLTTVTERTREIGLRKAIGAKAKDINTQFLMEAVMLTLIGGVLGTLLGALISVGISLTGLLTTQLSWLAVALAFGVSALIGVVFGYYPARHASKLNPIDALRYE